MAELQKRSKPSVTHMASQFFKIKQLPQTLGLFNNHTNTDGQPVKFRDNIRCIRVTTFGSYDYRESFDEAAPWRTVNIRRTKEEFDSTNIQLASKPSGSMIPSPKVADIAKQMKFIPLIYQPFYKNIIEKRCDNDDVGGDDDDDDDDDDDVEPMGLLNEGQSSRIAEQRSTKPARTRKQDRGAVAAAGHKRLATTSDRTLRSKKKKCD